MRTCAASVSRHRRASILLHVPQVAWRGETVHGRPVIKSRRKRLRVTARGRADGRKRPETKRPEHNRRHKTIILYALHYDDVYNYYYYMDARVQLVRNVYVRLVHITI